MFNAPRRNGPSYLSSSAFISPSTSSSTPYADPLASSTPNPGTYGEVDPWSAAPSPARTSSSSPRLEDDERPVPPPSSQALLSAAAGGGGAIAREGLNAFISDPPALYLSLYDQMDPSTIGYVSLASAHRLLATSKLPAATIEKIINLTSRDKSSLTRQEFFCALALVALAQATDLPTENLSIERLSTSLQNLRLPRVSVPASSSSAPSRGAIDSPALAAPQDSPAWDAPPLLTENGNGHGSTSHYTEPSDTSAFDTSQSERGYWKRLEHVQVGLITEREGWFLQKYKVESDKRSGEPVSRRYSDFVWLLDALSKRYPFRLLPSLPPKKIGPDASFLEQRRKALQRFLSAIVNHPVMKDDGALNVFLTEQSFEAWRKRTKVSTDEESMSKRLSPAQEMAIPGDLEDKLSKLRERLPGLLASYQKLVTLAERSVARLQAANADASRFALSLQTVGEEMPQACFKSSSCGLCGDVGRGLGTVGEHWTRIAEEGEKSAIAILITHIEALKTQRDLYVSFRDLFARHETYDAGLSRDNVDALRKKVEGRLKKVDTHKSAQKPGWEVEVDKLVAANDTDNSTISALLSRRVFIKACMWHELSVVFHSRQSAQVTLGWKGFIKDQEEGSRALGDIWQGLSERLAGMPVE